MPLDPKLQKWYEKHDVTPPLVVDHGTEADLEEKLKGARLTPHSWKLEGNLLTGMSERGNFTQKIPTNYILTGTDDKGLPVFTKVKLSV